MVTEAEATTTITDNHTLSLEGGILGFFFVFVFVVLFLLLLFYCALFPLLISMFETDKIPAHWIEPCNELVDEIWVPSKFNVETFNASGVNASKLRVLGEPIDVHLFNPEIATKMDLQQRRAFNFLAIGKWEKRKGWPTLIESYWNEFSSQDDVNLFIRSNMDDNNRQEFRELREKYLKANSKK
jgi:glycosyltransferase involved in cell wall biosynthesis